MNATRQDAWTEDEDIILAETVLRYIREGKTQLEAFKEVAKRLSRTSAACGFRWNATIRKEYSEAIQQAKEERKKGNNLPPKQTTLWTGAEKASQEKDTLETAILLLEKMKSEYSTQHDINKHEKLLNQLKEENEQLKEKLTRYENAWKEMGNLWNWVREKDQK
ncbi:transcription factor, RsfA family [Oceanobacillus limi]|uniref:Transcription factor, RsfA family n=1 Tax=Oceanobacillus limi TaxID=930131 RepID=A0A1I0DDM1_9BACI|nr:RsfA family transcriptional regulator [Oceanobacillus limi]SET30122.1 transcription factor, RsfA family [Oceanobacillus limi]